jgi:UDP-N-acetylglucosamine 2-epimerase (non-hydrolysing)
MPEEINRILTDSVANLLLTPSPDGDENLRAEGVTDERIARVGNVMIDSLYSNLEKAKQSSVKSDFGLQEKYAILTLHRPSNVDNKENFSGIIGALEHIGEKIQIIFPMHPRTEKMAKSFSLYERIESIPNIVITGPVGYLDFVALMASSTMALTDSGGLQEETTALGIPCITLRENTERPITVTEGTNTIVGCDPELIKKTAMDVLETGGKSGLIPDLWDGKTSQRIADVLLQYISDNGD